MAREIMQILAPCQQATEAPRTKDGCPQMEDQTDAFPATPPEESFRGVLAKMYPYNPRAWSLQEGSRARHDSSGRVYGKQSNADTHYASYQKAANADTHYTSYQKADTHCTSHQKADTHCSSHQKADTHCNSLQKADTHCASHQKPQATSQ
ncbi:hypothetical protein P7K49_016576 [Saguinus oedipus]|uniref:Uncharacterized protein n=1 Tax=Saguinus oedipus TaxID=9490 RepID=A0ABQ9VFE0_SAGOE|nr:hypothetical protein P7K49_016576 [Saguinus oedipus]